LELELLDKVTMVVLVQVQGLLAVEQVAAHLLLVAVVLELTAVLAVLELHLLLQGHLLHALAVAEVELNQAERAVRLEQVVEPQVTL
jgi:hypothetical protein